MKMCHESYQIAGIAVGNGFTDPITILDYSHFVYQLGLVDTNAYNDMKLVEEDGKKAIQEGRLVDAFLVRTTIRNMKYSLPATR
jgi:vitellogenic carboxypeptidase-like protein